MQVRHEQRGFGLLTFGGAGHAQLPDLTVFVEQLRELQFGDVGRQTGDVHLHRFASWEAAHQFAQILLQPPDHHTVEVALENLDAAGEPLRIQQLKQRAEAAGMAVVRGGGQEEAMLEPRGQIPNGAGDPGINGVLGAAGRRGVVGFVEDQQ